MLVDTLWRTLAHFPPDAVHVEGSEADGLLKRTENPPQRRDEPVNIFRTPKTMTAVMLAVAGTVVLAGCAPEAPAPTETPTVAAPSPEPTSTPDPAEDTPVGVEALLENAKAGDVVDAETAAEINANAYMASKPRAYALPTGEHVLVLPDEPLPAPVVEAVDQKATDAANTGDRNSSIVADIDAAVLAMQEAEKKTTGRTVIPIVYIPGALDERKWGVYPPISEAFVSKEEAVARAEQYAAPSPNAYVIVVVE